MQPYLYSIFAQSLKMEIDPSKSDFNKTLAPWLGKTSKMMNMYISDVFHKNDFEVTKQQWIVLKILHEDADGIIQNKLAFITERNKASLTRLINVMEKKKLVIRSTSEIDSRKNLIHITKKGKDLFLKIKPILLKSITAIQNGISTDEMGAFINVMTKIQHNLNTQKFN